MKINTKNLVMGGLLAALSILIPNISPTLPLGPFTATFASHLPVMIAMFVSPSLAAIAAAGSAVGFLLKFPGMPWVAARALMHIPFAVMGAFMLRKGVNRYLTGFLTMFPHAILEVLVVLPFLGMMPTGDKPLVLFGTTISLGWMAVIFFGTSIHHIIDYAMALVVVPFLKKAKVMD